MIMYCIFSPWALLDKLSEDDRIRLAISTASPTPEGAWRRHIGREIDDGEFAIRVQRWFDNGYRVRACKVELLPLAEF